MRTVRPAGRATIASIARSRVARAGSKSGSLMRKGPVTRIVARGMPSMRVFTLLATVAQLSVATLVFADQPQPILPDPKLTPGDVFDVTAADVCTPGYSKKVRNVPQTVKEEVYR